VVEEMTIASGLGKMPRIFVIDDPSPNAFATGRSPDNAAVAVTSGLLRACTRDELQGVIAHELGHIKNRDILLMMVAGIMVGAIAMLAHVGIRGHWFGGGRSRRSGGGEGQLIIVVIALVMMILAPILARLVYFAISRKREYLADASAALYTRYPEGLASALEKISASPAKLGAANKVTAPMYIVNPLARQGARAADVTSTHPPISERVRILRAMGGATFAEYDRVYRQTRKTRQGVIPESATRAEAEQDGDGDDFGIGGGILGTTLAGGVAGGVITAGIAAGTAAGAAGGASGAGGEGSGGAGAAGPAPKAGREAEKADTPKGRAREVDDFLYRKDQYQALACPCGATLKIPPGFLASRVKCPHCDSWHETSAFQLMENPPA